MAMSCQQQVVKSNKKDGKSFDSCCHAVAGCGKNYRAFFCTPLELTFPNIYGKLDRGQEALIKNGAGDVVST